MTLNSARSIALFVGCLLLVKSGNGAGLRSEHVQDASHDVRVTVESQEPGRSLVKKAIFCPMIFYTCPENSIKDPSRPCLTGFKDCKCNKGYERIPGSGNSGLCLKKRLPAPGSTAPTTGTGSSSECKNDFQCPSNSSRKADRQCYDSFRDCKCDQGYRKKNGKCRQRRGRRHDKSRQSQLAQAAEDTSGLIH